MGDFDFSIIAANWRFLAEGLRYTVQVTLTAMVGGILLGVIEALGAAYISIAWKDAIAFAVLILILIFRPTGLLGERVADKV